MLVLGFDPSLSNFGWVLHDTEAEGEARCLDRGRFQTSTSELFVDRYCDIRDRVYDLVEQTGVRTVGQEYPVFNNLWSEGMYGVFLYTCEALRAQKCDVAFFSPGQLKAQARYFLDRPKIGGKLWKMKKRDMCEAARKDTGGRGRWNHNEADAYWAARCGGRFFKLLDGDISREDLEGHEPHMFTEVHTYTRGTKKGRTVKKGILYREDERFFRWSIEGEDGEEEEVDEQEE